MNSPIKNFNNNFTRNCWMYPADSNNALPTPPGPSLSPHPDDFLDALYPDTGEDSLDYLDSILNTRQIPYPGSLRTLSRWEALLKIGSYAALILVSVVGNSLVVTTVSRMRSMRTTTNYFLVNLAVCDLIVTVFCTWVHLVTDLSESWVLGALFCKISSFVQVLSLVASILTLTLIACDRFFGIMFAMRARLTDRRPWTFILLVWVVSGIIAFPLLFHRTQLTRVWRDHVEIWCTDTWPYVEVMDAATNTTLIHSYTRTFYYTTVSLVLYFLPVLIMSVVYAVIIGKLWSRRAPGDGFEFEASVQLTVKKKIVKMLSVILSVFMVCWMPSQITILYAEYRTAQHLALPAWYNNFQYFATFLAYSNSAINPIIYTCFSENFRKGFRECLRCQRRVVSTSTTTRRRFHFNNSNNRTNQKNVEIFITTDFTHTV